MRRPRSRGWTTLPTSLALLALSLGAGDVADAWVGPLAVWRATSRTTTPGPAPCGGSLAAATRGGARGGRVCVLGGGGLLRHPSSASACGRRSRLGNFRMSSGAGGSSSNKEFQIQTVEGEEEVRGLALLCLESFYGKQRPVDYLNPIGALQRSLVFEQVVEDLSMRVRRYKTGRASGKICGTCICAFDLETGELAGFVDLSLTLFDRKKERFVVGSGPGVISLEKGTERRPYLANLAVSPTFMRRGVGRMLVKAVEEEVRRLASEEEEEEDKVWGKGLWLEVSATNEAALSLYKSLGYQVAWQDNDAREVLRKAFTYEFGRVVRVCLSKPMANEVPEAVSEPTLEG